MLRLLCCGICIFYHRPPLHILLCMHVTVASKLPHVLDNKPAPPRRQPPADTLRCMFNSSCCTALPSVSAVLAFQMGKGQIVRFQNRSRVSLLRATKFLTLCFSLSLNMLRARTHALLRFLRRCDCSAFCVRRDCAGAFWRGREQHQRHGGTAVSLFRRNAEQIDGAGKSPREALDNVRYFRVLVGTTLLTPQQRKAQGQVYSTRLHRFST